MDKTATTLPTMVRCRIKGCRFVTRFDCPARVTQTRDRFGTDRTHVEPDYFVGRPECPDHGNRRMVMAPIRGTVTDTRCGPRCTNAKGLACECECGGVNHGTGH